MEQNQILDGKLSKSIMMFFWPIWLGTFFQMLYNTADAVIVGNFVGKQALAAVGGPTGTIINLLVGFFVGLSAGAGVVIAQCYGARNMEKGSRAMHSAMAIAVVGGIILMCVGIPLSPMILKSMGTPADVLEYAVIYIRIYFAGSIFNLVYNIGSGVLRAMGDSKKPLQFLIVGSAVNIALDIVFVVFFKMGVTGVAVATVVSQAVTAALVVVTLMVAPCERKLNLKLISFDKETCGEIFKIGIPTGLQSVLFSISNVAIQSSINSFGTDAVAAWTAYGKLDAVFWMTLNSFGITITTFVSQNFGAKNFARVKQCVKVGVILSSIITLTLAVLLFFFSGVFYRIFTKDVVVIDLGIHIMKIMAPFYICYVGIEILSGAMRGVGESIAPAVITVFGICFLRIAWIAIAVPFNPVLDTAIISYPITWASTSLMFILYYLFGGWFEKAKKRLG